jgi:hypothetical protein
MTTPSSHMFLLDHPLKHLLFFYTSRYLDSVSLFGLVGSGLLLFLETVLFRVLAGWSFAYLFTCEDRQCSVSHLPRLRPVPFHGEHS